jgi:hypothetical protein
MEISGVLITMKRRFFLAIFLLPLSLVFQMASAATTGVSSNWAGYVASGGTFTAVGGNWIVPQAVISNANLSADATWVGIGGVSGKDLIQAGTQDIIQNGTPTYTAWYELLPASLVQIPLAVHPNDGITVSIAQQSNNEWQISFSDTTTGQSYQTSVSYVSSLSSAEWIEEMPSDQRGLVSLDNFGTVSFSNCFDVQNGFHKRIGCSAHDNDRGEWTGTCDAFGARHGWSKFYDNAYRCCGIHASGGENRKMVAHRRRRSGIHAFVARVGTTKQGEFFFRKISLFVWEFRE